MRTLADIPTRYQRWNDALVSGLFPTGRTGAPVYLSVYDALLEDYGAGLGVAEDGRQHFIAAVRDLAAEEPLFDVLARLARVWEVGGCAGSPPFVAGLALAVLAAGDMRTDDSGVTQANYYHRLNEILGAAHPEQGMPQGFERTPILWTLLAEWVQKERRGRLAVRGLSSKRRFVNPVKSQCLVRVCDVAEMSVVLRAAGHRPGFAVEPEDVAPVLNRWLRGPGATSRLAKLLGNADDAELLLQAAEALADAAEALDEGGEDSLGVAASETDVSAPRFVVEPYYHPRLRWRRARWCLEVDVGESDSDETTVAVGGRSLRAVLDPRDPPSYIATLEHSLALQAASRRLVVEVDGVCWRPEFLVPAWLADASPSGRRGLWEFVRSLEPGREYVLVAAEKDRAEAMAMVSAAAERPDELEEVVGDAGAWPGTGLIAFARITVATGASVPGIDVRKKTGLLRLFGGLAVRRRVYLRGGIGTPDVPGDAVVQIRQTHGRGPFVAGGRVRAHALSGLDLGEGVYRISHGESAVMFSVTDPRWPECRSPKLTPVPALQSAMAEGTVRGTFVRDSPNLFVRYLNPGSDARIYAPNVNKVRAPPDGGIFEYRSRDPIRQVVLMSRSQHGAPALPADVSLLRDSWDSDANDRTSGAEYHQQADLLLAFISAKGMGRVEQLRSICRHLAPATAPWHFTLALLEELGHVDVDWDKRRWCVAPPAFCPRSARANEYFLAGARTRDLVDRVAELASGRAELIPSTTEPKWVPSPIVLHAPARDVMSGIARELDIPVLPDSPAEAIATRAKAVSNDEWWLGPEFAPAGRVASVLDVWNADELRWRSYEHQDLHTDEIKFAPDSLYRWRERGAARHVLMGSQVPRLALDPSAAKWSLAPKDRAWLVYEPESRVLRLPAALGLPRVLARACALASGSFPKRIGSIRLYDCVSITLGRAVAIRLGQARAPGLW